MGQRIRLNAEKGITNMKLSWKRVAWLWIALVLVMFPDIAGARQIVDMAGRSVTVPDVITKAYGSSPPAMCLIYAMDPDLLAGLNYPVRPDEARFMNPAVAKLPVIGGWFGQGRTPNLETLLKVKPDVMIAWLGKFVTDKKTESVARELGIPVVYIRFDHLSDYVRAFTLMGELLNRTKRAQMLSDYTGHVLKSVHAVVEKIPESQRVSVYYAEGMDGLSTECDQSFHTELISAAGGQNVYRCVPKDVYGMERISLEQVMLFNPQVILAQEKNFTDTVFQDSRWQSIRAVRTRRVYRIPRSPFNWFDRPPSFMRILGVQWLLHCLYPDRYTVDMASETRQFYKLFLGVDLNDKSLREVLE